MCYIPSACRRGGSFTSKESVRERARSDRRDANDAGNTSECHRERKHEPRDDDSDEEGCRGAQEYPWQLVSRALSKSYFEGV